MTEEEAWAVYERDMLLFDAGLLRPKPHLPFQHGHYIDTLPREANVPADPKTGLAIAAKSVT